MFMLDTSVIVEFLRGRLPHTLEALRRSDPRSFKIPAVVEAELRYGVLRAKDPVAEQMKVERFLAPFEIVPFDSRCAAHYADARAALARQGRTIGPNDLRIAATALANAAVLVTRNDREFLRIPGLKLEYWDELEHRIGAR